MTTSEDMCNSWIIIQQGNMLFIFSVLLKHITNIY